ncbi:Hypothetical predicted protein [Mytilus galloprovincialis]|uniref:Uncharacterized protein n=1 Tax=Mytilus galloprovincialis TaxID=29158 RepID=A0A8B6CQS1_MYTGA|nr:Hypothetical predicted protein [Mytilus galloprovincialis]
MASSEHVAIDTKEKGNGKDEMENTVKTNAGIESQTKKIVETVDNVDQSTEVQIKLVDDGTTVKVEQDKEQDEREGSIMENKENNQAETDSNDEYKSAAEDISDAGSGGTNSENDSEHADQENTEDRQGQTKKESKRVGSSKKKKKKKKKQQRKLQNQQKKESENRQQKEHNDQEDQLTGENIKEEDIKAEQLPSDSHDKKDVTTSTEEQKVKTVEAATIIKDEANITAELKTTKVETSTSEEKDEVCIDKDL